MQPLVLEALQKRLHGRPYRVIKSLLELPEPSSPVLQYRVYEKSDFEHVMAHPSTCLVNSYIIRKALNRKHYLSNTVANWIAKHPDSILRQHFKSSVDFELDYAEFLDEALLEAYELHESFARNESPSKKESEREWWILKPGMSDRAQGIRLFDSESALQKIFEEWEPDQPDSDEGEESDGSSCDDEQEQEQGKAKDNGIVTSQLRHFIAQPYIHPPLLLASESNRKFHIRTYVLAVGSLQVYVYREMLALFAEKPYRAPWEGDVMDDLTRHLTNTCLQSEKQGSVQAESVRRFWSLEDRVPSLEGDWKESVYDQICAVTGEVFEAAARGMLVHFQTLPNAFELFGVDFLVDGGGNVWLLELNAFPDFRQTGEELKREVVGKLFEGVVDVAIIPFFDGNDFESGGGGGGNGKGDGAAIGSAGDGLSKDQHRSGLRLVADLNLGVKR